MSRKGSNREKCKRYAIRHGGEGRQRKHYGRKHRNLNITGVIYGLPISEEVTLTEGMLKRRIGSK